MRLNELVARDLSDYAIPEPVRNQQLETNINAHIRGYTRIRTHITTKASAQASALDPCSAIHLRRCFMESLQPCSAIHDYYPILSSRRCYFRAYYPRRLCMGLASRMQPHYRCASTSKLELTWHPNPSKGRRCL